MNARKFLCAVIATLITVPLLITGVGAETIATIKADGFDTARGSGMLVIYTPKMGATTATNEWGSEAVIENDRCVKVGGNDNAIPANGFVISGHNEDEGGKQMGKWITDNIHVGDYVYYDANGKITVSDTPIENSSYYEITATINGVNVTRNTDFLVIYNRRGSKTSTNQWGFEAVVTAGFITSLGGNDNLIPSEEGSFVISGHGTMSEWIQLNAKLGMRAEYSAADKTLKLIYDEEAALAGSEAKYNVLSAAYDKAVAEFMNFDYTAIKTEMASIKKAIESSKSAYNKNKDGAALAEAASAIDKRIDAASAAISEKRAVEYRAVWLRPTQTSAAEVDAYVEQLYQNGINTICIETIYDCTMIMPMPEDSLFEVNPKFKHFDMLQSYIDSCHKRGMELHLWFPIFYVGDAASTNAKRSPASKMPEWRSISNNGTWNNSDNFMMLDPGNEEVQDFLLANYKYILETYDIDGFQLDYIRYYSRGDIDFGYNQSSLDAFKEKYGSYPTFDTKSANWSKWVQFRCDYVTTFVSRMRKLIDEVAPDVLLSADVGPNPTEAKNYIYQDYFNWLENGWIDILFPMAYGLGFESAIASQTEHCGDQSFIAVGLGIFMTELGPDTMFDQVNYGRSIGTDGAAFFEANSYLKKSTGEFLMNSVYSEKALAPNFDKIASIKASAEQAIDRINNVIVPLKGMKSSDAQTVVSALQTLAASTAIDKTLYEAAVAALEASNASEAAAAAVKRDLSVAAKIIAIDAKDFDQSDLPDTPVDVGVKDDDTSDTSVDESKDDASAASDAEVESNASADQQGENNSTADEENTNKTGLIIALAAAAAAVVAVIASIIYKKKKLS